MVQILLGKDTKIGRKNVEGKTDLAVAALNGHFEIPKMLVEKNANVNEKDH